MTGLVFRSRGMTDPGARRRLNEDSFVDRPEIGLWAVADGAGGHQAGEVASGLISQSLNDIAAGLSLEEMQADVRARLPLPHSGSVSCRRPPPRPTSPSRFRAASC